MTELVANLATTTLANTLSAGGLSATVVADGAFPSTGNFRIRIGNEIILVTDTTGSNVFGGLTRGAEGTTATSHAIGDDVRQVLTRDSIAQLILDGAGASDPQLATLAAMDDTHATTLRDATAWGLALLLDANATDTKTALGLQNVDNTPDSAKQVSSLQAAAIAKVPRNPINTTPYDVLPTDIGQSIDMGVSGAQTVTLRTASSVGVAIGQWFDVVNVQPTGAKAFAWEAGVTIRDPVTGTAIAGSNFTAVAPYERLRFYYIGLNVWGMVGRPAAAAASPDITVLKEAALNIEDTTLPGGGAVAGAGHGAANRTAIQALLDYAGTTVSGGAEVLVPSGKVFEVASPGGAAPIGIQVKNYTTLNLMGDINATGTWAAGGCLVKCATTAAGGQVLNGGLVGTGNLDCGDGIVDYALMINTARHSRFRDFTIFTPKVAGIYCRNTSTTQDSDSCVFDQIWQRGNTSGATQTTYPSRFMIFEVTTAKTLSDMTITNCKTQGGMLPQATPGTLSTGGWAFELINANRIEFNGGNFSCHHNFVTVAGTNACYSGGWLIRSTGGKNADDNVIINPYCEATPTSGGANPNWDFTDVRLEVTSGAGSIDGTRITGLHRSVSAQAGNSHRLVLNRVAASGTITHTKYRDPRNVSNDAGAFVIGSGCTNNYIETMGGADAAPDPQGNTGELWTNSGGTTNRKRGLVAA